ncbi:MAG: transposase, partial [Ktedonobacteraceae bacterium]|nr:transposase [Ktedonobacteraceae bacterium]
MFVYEYKLAGTKKQYAAIDEAIRTVQFIRNKCLEDLQIANMVRNHKLAKPISDASWGRFLQWVQSYGTLHNIPVIAVPPQYTSQNCSGCGKVVKKALSERTHRCMHCGLVMDRDENAAINILHLALTMLVLQTFSPDQSRT